ncbi:MAG: hypothetical protein ACLP0J_26805 [Solirubrobacteraceae bacterium]|jgi:hypothetical protein
MAPESRSSVLLRNIDIVVVAALAVPLLVVGVPAFGYAVGVIAWIAQRIIQASDRRLLTRLSEPRAQLGAHMFESFGRIWLLAGAIVLAGLAGDRADGLTAALVIFGAYSLAFVVRVLSGPPNRKAAR